MSLCLFAEGTLQNREKFLSQKKEHKETRNKARQVRYNSQVMFVSVRCRALFDCADVCGCVRPCICRLPVSVGLTACLLVGECMCASV